MSKVTSATDEQLENLRRDFTEATGESIGPRKLDITQADVWADFRQALGYDQIEPLDASFKSLREIMEGFAERGISRGLKALQASTNRAVLAGRMERQWQMRPTAVGQRKMAVYRVVKEE